MQSGNYLQADASEIFQILAKPEPILTVTVNDAVALLRVACHLGNPHVPVEICAEYLQLSPDSVLADLLRQFAILVTDRRVPFYPESGAYKPH